MRCYNIKIQICSISLLHFCFKDLLIEKGPIAIACNEEHQSDSSSKKDLKENSLPEEPVLGLVDEDEWHEAFTEALVPDLPAPRLFKISASVVTLAQFFGVRLLNVSLMFLRDTWPGCLLHATAERLEIEAATLNQTNVALSVSVHNCHVKMLQPSAEKHVQQKLTNDIRSEVVPPARPDDDIKEQSDKSRVFASVLGSLYGGRNNNDSRTHDPSLLECSFSSKFYVQVDAEHHAYMETVSLELKTVKLDVRDRLFVFMQDRTAAYRSARAATKTTSSPLQQNGGDAAGSVFFSVSDDTNYSAREQLLGLQDLTETPTSIATAVPAVSRFLSIYWHLNVNLSLEDVSMNVTSHPTRSNVLAQMSSLQFTLRIPRAPHTLQATPALLPEVYSSFSMDGVQLNSSHHSFLSLRTLRSDSSHLGRRAVCGAELHSFLYWFDHRDLSVFLPYLSCLLNSAAPPKPAPERKDQKKLVPLLRACCDSVHLVVELRDIGVGVKLPSGPPLLLSLLHGSLDTGTGDFVLEAFTSQLGRECCCLRPLRLLECYCEAANNCTTGRCPPARRHSGGGELKQSPDPVIETRHRRSVGHAGREKVTSSLLGQYGTQNYLLSLTDLMDYTNVGNRAQAPYDELQLLAQLRGGDHQERHIWGSPVSLGLCCVHFSPGSVFHEAPHADIIDMFEGNKNFMDSSRSSDGCRQRYFSRGESGVGSFSSSFQRHRSSQSLINDPAVTEQHTHDNVTNVHLDHLQLEWSPSLANFMCAVLSYAVEVKQFLGLKPSPQPSHSSPKPDSPVTSSHIESLKSLTLDCSSINIFAHTKYDRMCRFDASPKSLMLRCDSVRSARRSTALFHGLKLIQFVPQKKPFHCEDAASIKCGLVVADVGVLSVVLSEGDTLLEVRNECSLHWWPATHLTLFAVFMDLKELSSSLRSNHTWTISPTSQVESPTKPKTELRLQVLAKSPVSLRLTLSERHEARLSVVGFTFLTAKGLTCIQASLLDLDLDQHKIMSVTDGKLVSSFKSSELRNERQAFPELEQPINKAWRLTIAIWKVTFPYEFDFAEAFHEDFLCLVKWLKTVHKNTKKVSSPVEASFVNSPTIGKSTTSNEKKLPPDIIVKVTEWVVSVEDDPFEVKLRYNYELMEDEYQESCKRKKAFNARINDLQRSGAFLTSNKIEELHKSLKEKDSETYIKRSKQMYESTPVRSPLFTWVVKDLVGFALADPSFDGKENILRNMEEIDSCPNGDEEFSTLWCRMLSASVGLWQLRLRDYPQPLLDVSALEMWGRLVCGEQCAPHKRGERTVVLPLPAPWHDGKVKRCLAPRKFYHDFTWEARTFILAYGPCWEPAMSQFSLAMSLVTSRSVDPSLPLPWWDKVRLLLHGRLLLLAQNFTLKLHASLDPYNTTEEMELTWTDLTMDWVNAKLDFSGDLNVFVRTASKYDDARLLRMPNLRLELKLRWICLGDPNDHHAVILCAPDKLPEYSSNQEHDSYRSFRSRNLDININLETRPLVRDNVVVNPVIEMLFYGSTLRWFENLKFILSGVTRPIRRGKVFNNTAPRKPQLSRHYRNIHLALALQVWLQSVLTEEEPSVESYENEETASKTDGKKSVPDQPDGQAGHKTRPDSKGSSKRDDANKTGDNHDAGAAKKESDQESTRRKVGPTQPPQVEKFYFLHVTKVAYMHETLSADHPYMSSGPATETPQHRLVVHHLKGAWTTHNRDIVLALYDSWTKSRQLKHNLRPDVLQSFSGAARNARSAADRAQPVLNAASPSSLHTPSGLEATPSPLSRLQSGTGADLLHQLIKEAENNFVAYSEDCSNTSEQPRESNTLHGVTDCTMDDVVCKRWLIELVNSQVLLKGCETQGYVILSAAKSQVIQRIHRPAWRQQTLNSKTTWYGSLECMQYYATIISSAVAADNILWLSVANIEERGDAHEPLDLTDIVGSNQCAGGVVTDTVGGAQLDKSGHCHDMQLQRIVSRCRCEFYYVCYGELGMEPELLGEVQPPPPNTDELWGDHRDPTDTFTLMHHDLCISTNSLQYNMVVDILNKLLLYVDPVKKAASSALARMRNHLLQLRALEKDVYLVQRALDRDPQHDPLLREMEILNKRVDPAEVVSCKERLSSLSQELAIRIHCYNESLLRANHKMSMAQGDKVTTIRINEVFFRKAQWRLTEDDGQLGISEVALSNFLYTKKTNSDDSGEHLLELGYVNMKNLLPNQAYRDVLAPTTLTSACPLDRQKTLRIFCREKPPCGGISVIDHFEINVVPLDISLTYQFYKTILKFCFPDNVVVVEESESRRRQLARRAARANKDSHFYVKLQKDDVEIMKQRAEQNKMFVYIKIPELKIRLSYKGMKEKNLTDVTNFRLVVPSLEYHNVTWTWLDFLNGLKEHCKSALVPQCVLVNALESCVRWLH
ncbi:hypothetical protein HAZT_HAZT000626 [Hyalella azteca]|uniref:FMP27/BLTP2/Hobbit GFWDK motif-containing RBG unit domain-containing protein n=1 Tax=Hyalella azteca TaxID=294128 RepID=A0A6A0H8H6_HYAAZ|nr:hypothetical protein HAZT_HAZT000626 [Hyalella azteca]